MKTVDTNILLYAVNRDSPNCQQACHALEAMVNGGGSWGLSWKVVYEFLRVATHPRIFSSPLDSDTAWEFVHDLTSSETCIMLSETALHEERLNKSLIEKPRLQGNLFHDFNIAVLMREHGVTEIISEDRDFRMFPWIRVTSLKDFISLMG